MSERELFDQWYGKKPKGWFEAVRYNTAWRAWQASANRQGYKLVPVEPTEEMIDAGVEWSDVDWKRLKFAYQAMIGAVE